MQTVKLLLLQTRHPAWHGTQNPLFKTEPWTQNEQTEVLLTTLQVAQLVPHEELVVVELMQALLESTNPTGQDVQEEVLLVLQVEQLDVQSWQVLFETNVLPG